MEILLKQFVEETINEVIAGIVNSQKNMLATYKNYEDPQITISAGEGRLEKINFDVLVTSSNNSESGGKAGLSIKVLDIGGSKKNSNENTAENRIQFSVQIKVESVDNAIKTK